MNELVAKLETLEPDHRDALSWFWDRRGQEIPWTEILTLNEALHRDPQS